VRTGASKGRRHLGQTKAALKGRWWHEGQKVSGMEVLGGGCTGHEQMIQEGKIVFCMGQMNNIGPGMQAAACDVASKRQAVDSQS